MATDPITDTLPFDYDGPDPDGRQVAFAVTVQLLIPCRDSKGVPVNDAVDASDYVAETLRDRFLDWCYIDQPEQISVFDPYIEGTGFSTDEE